MTLIILHLCQLSTFHYNGKRGISFKAQLTRHPSDFFISFARDAVEINELIGHFEKITLDYGKI